MGEELLPIIVEGRPTVLKDSQGWTVFVSIHDAEYLRIKKALRRQLAAAHPDKLGLTHAANPAKWKAANMKFARLHMALKTWILKERGFYWRLGLMPPDWSGAPEPPSGLRESVAQVVTYERKTSNTNLLGKRRRWSSDGFGGRATEPSTGSST